MPRSAFLPGLWIGDCASPTHPEPIRIRSCCRMNTPGSGAPRSCDRSRRASPAPPAGRLFWGCLCGAGGAPGVTRGGACPNLPQRRPAAGLAAKKSAEYQRFFLRVPARYGSLWQIWTIRRLRPRAGRHGPAFPRARRGRPGGRRPHGPHGSRGPAGPAGVPPLARHYADPDPRTTAFGREGPVSTGAARRGPLRSTARTIRGRRERKPPQPPPCPRQPRITRAQTHPDAPRRTQNNLPGTQCDCDHAPAAAGASSVGY